MILGRWDQFMLLSKVRILHKYWPIIKRAFAEMQGVAGNVGMCTASLSDNRQPFPH